ncbi:MAG: hypothetical protein RIR70_1757 [Pseudomonadota bacterium]|jgi:hypothetical protein
MKNFGAHHGGADQAEGLRELFGPQTAKTYCLASALDADCTALLGVGTAHALANAGHRTLLVDEVPLSERQQLPRYAYPVRYDLGQVLSGFVTLYQALRVVNEKLFYAIGNRVRRAFDSHEAKPPNLALRLLAAQIDIDFILIASRAPHAGALNLYADEVRRIVVTSPEPRGIKKCLELLRDLSVLNPDQPLPLLVVGGATESEGESVFQHIRSQAETSLGIEIQSAGWIPAAALGNMDSSMMLPASLYRALAGAVSTMEFA